MKGIEETMGLAAAEQSAVTVQSDTAAGRLVSHVPTATGSETVSGVLSSFRKRAYDATDAVYVLDAGGHLMGLVALADLLKADPGARVDQIMMKDPVAVHPDEDQEQVANLAMKHGVTSVPVVNENRMLLGVVPSSTLFEILRREHIEDMNRLVGIWRENERARSAIEAPPTRQLRDRLPGLLVGLLGSMVATFVVSRFEQMLEARIAIAYFLPAIVYLADAIGTQTEAMAVRGLSLIHTPLRSLLIGELRTGLLIGLSLGAILFPVVAVAFGDASLAAAVALSVAVAGTFATTLGFLLPWALSWMGTDPAYGSGPVCTIIQYVLTLITYFLIAGLLVV
jgi:magnesium transporter